MAYWLFKSEPSTFGVDDLLSRKKQTEHWDGVRNYQARNNMMKMKKGDLGFFYHSSCPEPGIYGIVEVVKEAYPDFTQFDAKSKYFDAQAAEDHPRWFMVDVKLVEKVKNPLSLATMRENKKLQSMVLLKRGNRSSVLPVEEKHWQIIKALL